MFLGLLPLHHQSTTSPFEGGHRGLLLALPSNGCLSVCLLTPKTSLPIEAEATEKPCHSEEGVSPTWESVPLNVSIIWEFSVKTVVFRDTDCHGHRWPRNDNA